MPPLTDSNRGREGREESRSSSGTRSQASTSSPSSAEEQQLLPLVQCVLVGDGAVGKTSLLVSYSKSEECPSTTEYTPTAFDNYSVVVQVDGRPIRLQLCDTAGQDELDSLRTLCYSNSDVFLLCFSVTCHTSFENVTSKWLPEIRRNCLQDVPIILVGTQSDLRSNETVLAELDRYNEKPVPVTTAQQLAKSIGSVMYIECSAMKNQNVKDVFDAAIFVALDRQGFVRKCRGLGSIRGSKKYRCISKLWEGNAESTDADEKKKQRKRWKLFSCFST